jgi:antitoxin component YwqK of YwqJK toxin-antitoxin module
MVNLVKNLNMKKIKLLFIALLISNTAFLQKLPEINVKPIKEKGKAKIYYQLKSEFAYIPNTKLIDWKMSLQKLEVSERYDPKKQYFVESCKFVDGKKNGEFSISQLLLKETVTKYGNIYYTSEGAEVVSGNYLNDEYNGPLKFLTFTDFEKKEGYMVLNYENGNIANQTLKFSEPISVRYDDMFNGIREQFSVLPLIVFKNGKVKESFFAQSNKLPWYTRYDGDTIFSIRYTAEPLCFNKFTFLTDKDYSSQSASLSNGTIKQGVKLVDLNVNRYAIEAFKSVKRNNGNWLIEGQYSLFKPTEKLLDTSVLVSRFNYKNGERNGKAYIWDINKNGNTHNPYIVLNYKNELLDGKCELFYPDGKVAVSSLFSKGYLEGETVSYYNAPSNKVFKLNNSVNRWVEKGGILMINQIGKWSDDDVENIKLIREKGGVIADLAGYGEYCKVNYKIDSSYNKENNTYNKASVTTGDFKVYNNNSVMVEYIVNRSQPWKNDNVIWYDQNGKSVYSLNAAIKEVQKGIENKAKEIEERNNSIVSCEMCGKKIKYGDARILQEREVRCFHNDGSRVSLDLLPRYSGMKFLDKPYCSEKCKMDAGKECCRISGYRTEP